MQQITTNDIREFVLKECLSQEDGQDLCDDTELIGLKIIDSLTVLKLVTFLEETTGITISLDEIDFGNFTSIRAIHNFIQERIDRVKQPPCGD